MLVVPDEDTMPALLGAVVGGVAGPEGLLDSQAATLRAVTRAFDVDVDPLVVELRERFGVPSKAEPEPTADPGLGEG